MCFLFSISFCNDIGRVEEAGSIMVYSVSGIVRNGVKLLKTWFWLELKFNGVLMHWIIKVSDVEYNTVWLQTELPKAKTL